jgi:hypothetical protein
MRSTIIAGILVSAVTAISPLASQTNNSEPTLSITTLSDGNLQISVSGNNGYPPSYDGLCARIFH